MMRAHRSLASQGPALRDEFGYLPRYVRTADGVESDSIFALLTRENGDEGDDALEWDREGTLSALGIGPWSPRTCFLGVAIASSPRGAASVEHVRTPHGAETRAIQDALLRVVARDPDAPIAMSGGLDSALLLAAARACGGRPSLFTLRVRFPSVIDASNYDESERAAATAAALGSRVTFIDASEDDFVAMLPRAIERFETPLFNLHPVGRVLLADALGGLGVDRIVTGDGADQVFAGRSAHLWFPLAQCAFAGGGVRPIAPFLHADLVRATSPSAIDPDKSVLRSIARDLGVPEWVAEAKKVARYAPALDLSRYANERPATEWASRLDVAFDRNDPRDICRLTTLALLETAARASMARS